jgi:amino acid adenylation domain-containing protein
MAPCDQVTADPVALAGDGGELIHLAFLAQARRRPDAEALLFDGGAWTYGELLARTETFAEELRAAGVAEGARVAILAERRPELVVAMVGVARLGATFIVLDAAYPDARLAASVELSAPHVLVCTGSDLKARAEVLARTGQVPFVQTTYQRGSGVDRELDRGSPDSPAYFLFTSGTTGNPKCIAVSHRPLSRFVTWHAKTFELKETDRFSMLAGLSHDPLLRDVFTPLSIGASLAIPRQTTILEPGALTLWFKRVGATVTHLTPAMGQILVAGASRGVRLPKLRHLFWGGDKLLPSLVKTFSSIAPDAQHTNFYGSTETPQAATYFRCDQRDWSPCVPIGKGVDGFQVLIVDESRQPVQSDVEGEVAIRSSYLSLGHVDRGEINRGADAEDGGSVYYTGDRGHYLPDGSVMLLGRADDQVKIRGFRVELSEITAALLRHGSVESAATLASGDGAGLRVHAFVVAKGRSRGTRDRLIEHLAGQLPAYMAPHEIRLLDALPLLPNGKLDRQALLRSLEPQTRGDAGNAAEPANDGETDVERALIERFRNVPGLGPVSRNSSFASLGGDSLSYVQGYLLAEEVLGVVPPRWQEKTIADLAGSAVKRSAAWSVIDTPMLIRAVAIVAIVSLHLNLFRYDDGGTTALFLVSGFLFGGLQLPEALRRGSAQPIIRSILNIAIPTWIYAVCAFAQKALRGHSTTLMIPFLANDFIDYQSVPKTPHWASNYQIHLWYVDALIQMLVLLAVVVGSISASKRKFSIMSIAWVLFAFGCLTRFALPVLAWPELYTQHVHPLALVMYLPTTHFATLMLGVLAANAANSRDRLLLLAVTTGYAALTFPLYGLFNAICIEAATVALLFWGRIKVPRVLAQVVLPLSGASLFIYLLHSVFASAIRSVLPGGPLVEVVGALALGVLTWRAWLWGAPRLFLALRRLTGRDQARDPAGPIQGGVAGHLDSEPEAIGTSRS